MKKCAKNHPLLLPLICGLLGALLGVTSVLVAYVNFSEARVAKYFFQGLWAWMFFPYLIVGLGASFKQRLLLTECFIFVAVSTYYSLNMIFDSNHVTRYPQSPSEQIVFAILYMFFGSMMAFLFSVVMEFAKKRNAAGLVLRTIVPIDFLVNAILSNFSTRKIKLGRFYDSSEHTAAEISVVLAVAVIAVQIMLFFRT